MSSWLRDLGLALAVVALAACASSTRRGGDADADADGDSDAGDCAAAVVCEGGGFGSAFELDTEAEVVEASGDRIVMLDADGLPLTFSGCGLELDGLVAAGQTVTARNTRRADWGECWIAQVVVDGSPMALSASCRAEGEATPPLGDLGWAVDLESDCEWATDHVCTASGSPVHLSVPETVHAATVTTEGGARATVRLGESARAGDWELRLLDARTSEPLTDGGCFVPAEGAFAMIAARRATRPTCPEPPLVGVRLGLDVSASQTILTLTVLEIGPDRVVLATSEGTEVVFGWHGPDPSRALSVGESVTARRYDSATTGVGALDVLEAGGRVALAAISTNGFTIDVPDLSVLGVIVELGEPCTFDAGVEECTGDPLVGQRYALSLRAAPDSTAVEVEIGETATAGAWQATVLEASQYPGVWCPDFHVEAWGPFGLTLMQEENRE